MLNLNKKGHISELVGYSGTYIGSEVTAKGDIESEEDIFIDGNYQGVIITTGTIEIGKNANLNGSISARSAVLEGIMKADVMADDSLHVSGCCQIQGKIVSKNISIDPGAIINIRASTK